jgi:IS30 family transposase
MLCALFFYAKKQKGSGITERRKIHYAERQRIEEMVKRGSSVAEIAEALGVHRYTIYNEFNRCGCTKKTTLQIKARRHYDNKKGLPEEPKQKKVQVHYSTGRTE